MIELFLVKEGYMLEIPTASVTWSGQRYQAARKIEAGIFYDTSGFHTRVEVIEGDTVLFKWKGNELFRGTVFDRSRSKSGVLTLVAYDLLQYFLLNKELYGPAFKGKRLDQVLSRLCSDFEIPHSSFPNTKYAIPTLPVDTDTSLYDIALRAMVKTQKGINKKYHIYSRLGKIHLTELKVQDIQWVLELGNNIIDYNYNTSIMETITKVKMVTGEGKQSVTAIATDKEGRKQFGVLQYYEKVAETMKQQALLARANKILEAKKGVKRKIDVEALGIESVTSGSAIYVIMDDLRLKRSFFVDQDTHTFKGNTHTMSLKLIETNDFPEVEEPEAAPKNSSSGSARSTGAVSSKAEKVVELARSYIGDLTYHYGGKEIHKGSGDCSGFTMFIYNKVGINLGHGTMTQIKKGQAIPKSEARAGDLVFFKGTNSARGANTVSHVGIVTRPGYCVSLGNSGCKEHSYTSGYWGGFFMQIRRVL